MRLPVPRPRAGISLIEVLVAIFIMSVGLLALLALFPVGALSMARAVRDDRAATAGANAASLAAALNYRNDPTALGAYLPAGALTMTPAGYNPPEPGGPGYPVYLDPLYYTLPGVGSLGAYAGGAPTGTPGLTRCTLTSLQGNPALTSSLFTVMDEIAFDNNGGATGPTVNRPQTYTWAYLIRRGNSTLPEVSVVVYGGRSLDLPSGEVTYPASGSAGTNAVTLTYPAGARPKARKGSWVLDTTYNAYTVNGTSYGSVNGYCYQIATAVDVNNTTLQLELETNLRANVSTMVAMDNVITVLERGAAWKP